MEKFGGNISGFFSDTRKYLKEQRDSISEANFQMVLILSAIAVPLVWVFVAITPFIISEWRVSTEYIMLDVVCLVFFLFSFIFRKKIKNHYIITSILCIAFIICLLAVFAAISIIPYPDSSDIYFGLVIMIIPALFIFPSFVENALVIVFSVLYIILVAKFKVGLGREHDIFSTIFALLFSRIISIVTMRMRLQTYRDKMKLFKNSRVDQLTGLYNKITFEELCKSVCEVEDVQTSNAYLMIDIDNFKHINDNFGHREGDRLLRIFSNCMQSSFAVGDIIGRVGGDEFAVLLKNVSDKEMVERIINRFMVSVNKKTNESLNESVTASIGCVLLPDKTLPFSKIYESADSLLYQRKRNGKNGYIIGEYGNIDIKD